MLTVPTTIRDLGVALMLAVVSSAQAATYSLAEDFTYSENRTNSTWSYRLDDFDQPVPSFPLLTSSHRDVNALWGSTFPSPPLMWSETGGYWGIGRNLSGKPLFSARNGITWQPGEVLLHPKGGAAPSGLVVGWTAPSNMIVDVDYRFVRGADEGNGIGYQILRRHRGVDVSVVALDNIGSGLTNNLTGIFASQGDQLFFRFNTCGNPVGDISRADIRMESRTGAAGTTDRQLLGGTVVAGSDFTFSLPRLFPGTFQWHKDGKPIAGETNAAYRLRNVKLADAGVYSVAIDSVLGAGSQLHVTPPPEMPERFRSPVPRQVFARTLAGQEAQLKTNFLMLRFADSRKRLAADPYRPTYHFVSPEGQMNDPIGPCFWQGRWHLFYIAFPPDKFPDPSQLRERLLQAHWGHAVSDDWVHWRDLPYALHPGLEKVCATGGTVVEEQRVVAFYPGWEAGQIVAVSDDPLLLNWTKQGLVNTRVGDSCIWKEGDTYYGLTGNKFDYLPGAWWPQMEIWATKDLATWEALGEFIEDGKTPFTARQDDGACPNFTPIGTKHMLSFFSHFNGGQYFLGDYDPKRHRFRPYEHGRFNHGTVAPGGVHAPAMVADGQGGVINILNVNDGKYSDAWDQLMSLAQRLTLGPDKRLRIEPVAAITSLRGSHQQIGPTELPANQDLLLEAIQGNAMEMMVEIDPRQARWVQLNVLRSPNAEEQTSITFFNYDRPLAFWYHTKGVVSLDVSRSSSLPDVWPRAPEQAVLQRAQGETLRLRVFVDRSIVEVFANERQYLAARVYPGRQDSVGVSLRAHGQPALIRGLDAWQMKSIWP